MGVACTWASQAEIPTGVSVRSYPLLERYGWVWVWMGEPGAADPSLIPDFSQLTDPAFAAVGKTTHVEANYLLVNDNLMDLSHVGLCPHLHHWQRRLHSEGIANHSEAD